MEEIEKNGIDLMRERGFSEELITLLSEVSINMGNMVVEYRKNHNRVLNEYKDYFIANGIIIPKSIDDFFEWASIVFPDEPISFISEIAKKPFYYKLYHEYKERVFNNPTWTKEKEAEFINKSNFHTSELSTKRLQVETKKKYIAKEYALTYIFDLYANGKQLPINRVDGGYNQNEIYSVGISKGLKGNTFMKAIRDVKKFDINNANDLQSISKDWLNAVKDLSENWVTTQRYLIEKKILKD